MKLATTTGDFYQFTKSNTESLRLIREAGFHYADMNFNNDYADASGVFGADYEAYFDKLGAAAADIGITLVQAHAPLGKPLEDGGVLQQATLRCIEACGAWKIPNLVVHSGYSRGLTKQETFEQNKAFFLPLLEKAEACGVNILVENFNKMKYPDLYWIDNATDLLALIEYMDHPLFHAVWDVGHANMQPMPQDEALRLLGSHVRALHIQDNLEEKDLHAAPFTGTLNLDAVMHGLQDIGYDGYFTFEVRSSFLPGSKRRPYPGDTRLLEPPMALHCAFEAYLYQLGKAVLEAYDCYEI